MISYFYQQQTFILLLNHFKGSFFFCQRYRCHIFIAEKNDDIILFIFSHVCHVIISLYYHQACDSHVLCSVDSTVQTDEQVKILLPIKIGISNLPHVEERLCVYFCYIFTTISRQHTIITAKPKWCYHFLSTQGILFF